MDGVLRFITRAAKALVVLLMLAVLVNDGVRIASALMRASDGLQAGMDAALAVVKTSPENSGAAQTAAGTATTAESATLEAYEQRQAPEAGSRRIVVKLAVSAPLDRTLMAAPILGLGTGVPQDRWYADGGVKITLKSTKVVDEFGSTP